MHYGFWSVCPSAGQKTFPAMVHVQTVCDWHCRHNAKLDEWCANCISAICSSEMV